MSTKWDTDCWELTLPMIWKYRWEKRVYKICPRCGGSGSGPYDPYESTQEKCEVCRGAGNIDISYETNPMPEMPSGLLEHLNKALREFEKKEDF